MTHRPSWTRLLLLVSVAATAGRASADDAAPAVYFRMKLVKVLDAHGFEKPLTAVTLLVPIDWTLRGGVEYQPKNICTATLARVSFRAASPDGRTAVEHFPAAAWSWSDSLGTRQFMEQDRQTKARFGMKGCDIGPPLLARDYLSRVLLPAARPGARVQGEEADPEADKAVRDMARSVETEMSRVGVPTRVKADTARLRIAYDKDGQRQEEWVTALTFARATPAPSFDRTTGQIGQSLSYVCGADYVFAATAPAGRLQANERLFRAILGSIRVDPGWLKRVQQVQLNMQAAEVKGAADRSRIIARSAEDTRRILSETYQRRQESQDRSSERWTQTYRGVETFRNPTTGETVELSNRYGNAWSNGRDEYLLSDSPGFDPNTVSRENWTRLQPVITPDRDRGR
jgi:hypothetical protein